MHLIHFLLFCSALSICLYNESVSIAGRIVMLKPARARPGKKTQTWKIRRESDVYGEY